MTNVIAADLASKSPEEKREIARQMILDFCREKRESPNGMVHHTIASLRSHFNTIQSDKRGRDLGVYWQALIDAMIRDRTILITNGFVWLK